MDIGKDPPKPRELVKCTPYIGIKGHKYIVIHKWNLHDVSVYLVHLPLHQTNWSAMVPGKLPSSTANGWLLLLFCFFGTCTHHVLKPFHLFLPLLCKPYVATIRFWIFSENGAYRCSLETHGIARADFAWISAPACQDSWCIWCFDFLLKFYFCWKWLDAT